MQPEQKPAPRPWRDLRLRAISAAILAPTCLACIWLGEIAWTALIAVGMVGLAAEWVALCGSRAGRMPGIAIPVAVFIGCAAGVLDHEAIGLALLLLGCAACFALVAGQPRRQALALGVLYVGVPGLAMIWLRGDTDAGRANIFFIVLTVWAADIGAYLVGRLVGGPKLAPAISPGKTWSGAVGGLLAALLAGIAVAESFDHGPGAPSVGEAALVAVALGLVSQLGDLLESYIKRRFGVKDSGKLIPGHGGLLDRLDGLLAAAPAAALLALVLGRGVFLWR